jgi:hypothetical protein
VSHHLQQGNQGDSWLLVVGGQIDNLIHGPSFGHNLCFKNPNGSCEPILDIYVLKYFQWYKKNSIQWVLTPIIAFWRFRNPLGLQFPKWEFIWECGGSFPHTLLHSQEHEMWFSCSLLARTFVSPYHGRKPKAKVVIILVFLSIRFNYNIFHFSNKLTFHNVFAFFTTVYIFLIVTLWLHKVRNLLNNYMYKLLNNTYIPT